MRGRGGYEHLSGLWVNVGKGIQHVCQFSGREILRVVVAPVDSLSMMDDQSGPMFFGTNQDREENRISSVLRM